MSKSIETASQTVASVVTENVIERKETKALNARFQALPPVNNYRVWTKAVQKNAEILTKSKVYQNMTDEQFFLFFDDPLSLGALTTGSRATRNSNEYHSVAIAEEAARRGWLDDNDNTTEKFDAVAATFENLEGDEEDEE